jgi:hypothetical protein
MNVPFDGTPRHFAVVAPHIPCCPLSLVYYNLTSTAMPALHTWFLSALAAVQVVYAVPADISRTARCGESFGLTCKDSTFGNYCSKNGWCGSSKDYCGDGCQAGWGTCNTALNPVITNDGRCGSKNGECVGSNYGNCCR